MRSIVKAMTNNEYPQVSTERHVDKAEKDGAGASSEDAKGEAAWWLALKESETRNIIAAQKTPTPTKSSRF